MTLMLGAVAISGVGASKLLLELDVNRMLIRYPIAVCVAYGIFFLSVKAWLWYIGLLVSAIGFGWAAQHYCPVATKAAEIFHLCR
jgi:hypothetical protein